MSLHAVSLVLAVSTGWVLAGLGAQPVSTLRRLESEPVKAAAAWAVVAATGGVAVFHWYLIFALLCLVALTKLDRPAGKVWLAIAAALGLTLGVIFPLATAPELAALDNPRVLGTLYLGGAVSGLAYVRGPLTRQEAAGRAGRGGLGWPVALAVPWGALLVWWATRLGHQAIPLPGLPHRALDARWLAAAGALVLIVAAGAAGTGQAGAGWKRAGAGALAGVALLANGLAMTLLAGAR